MPAPASSSGQRRRKDGREKREATAKEGEGLRGFSQIDREREGGGRGRQNDGEKDRLFIQLLLSFDQQLSSLRPLFHPALPLSALSNEWQ